MFFGTILGVALVFGLILGPVGGAAILLFSVLIFAGAGADARRRRRGPRPPEVPPPGGP